jgi:hypothetical protein
MATTSVAHSRSRIENRISRPLHSIELDDGRISLEPRSPPPLSRRAVGPTKSICFDEESLAPSAENYFAKNRQWSKNLIESQRRFQV